MSRLRNRLGTFVGGVFLLLFLAAFVLLGALIERAFPSLSARLGSSEAVALVFAWIVWNWYSTLQQRIDTLQAAAARAREDQKRASAARSEWIRGRLRSIEERLDALESRAALDRLFRER